MIYDSSMALVIIDNQKEGNEAALENTSSIESFTRTKNTMLQLGLVICSTFIATCVSVVPLFACHILNPL